MSVCTSVHQKDVGLSDASAPTGVNVNCSAKTSHPMSVANLVSLLGEAGISRKMKGWPEPEVQESEVQGSEI
jgi:hypothetical protein